MAFSVSEHNESVCLITHSGRLYELKSAEAWALGQKLLQAAESVEE